MPLVQNAAECIQWHMDDILALFKPGMKITVLVRSPDHPDGKRDFLMTNDVLNEAVSAILRRKHDDATGPTECR